MFVRKWWESSLCAHHQPFTAPNHFGRRALLMSEFFNFVFPSPFQCTFSNGGHLFAAVHGNVIQIYSTSTFENVGNLKGHNGKVCDDLYIKWLIFCCCWVTCPLNVLLESFALTDLKYLKDFKVIYDLLHLLIYK